MWAPSGGTEPGLYEDIIRRMASHGFVVIAISSSPGNATKAIEALNWLEEKNKASDGPLAGKLDMNTVGCSGHSMGGIESEQAIIIDKRVKTSILNNSGDLGHSAMSHIPDGKSIAIVYGIKGMEKFNAELDYGNPKVKVPACLIMMDGGEYGHGCGPWDGMAVTVSWFR